MTGPTNLGSHVTLRPVTRSNLDEAVDTVASGMADNPLHVAAYGGDASERVAKHRRLVRAAFELIPHAHPMAAYLDTTMVGVASYTPPGHCRPTPLQRMRFVPRLASIGAGSSRHVLNWLNAWEANDPAEPHTHIGPVAVHSDFQGQGIGSALMKRLCEQLDDTATVGYLETDKRINVDFYNRFGFEVIGEADVIGVPNWFMRRQCGGHVEPQG